MEIVPSSILFYLIDFSLWSATQEELTLEVPSESGNIQGDWLHCQFAPVKWCRGMLIVRRTQKRWIGTQQAQDILWKPLLGKGRNDVGGNWKGLVCRWFLKLIPSPNADKGGKKAEPRVVWRILVEAQGKLSSTAWQHTVEEAEFRLWVIQMYKGCTERVPGVPLSFPEAEQSWWGTPCLCGKGWV